MSVVRKVFNLIWFVFLAPVSQAGIVEVKAGSAKAPDGLRIDYDVRGKGETSLVFVHCWSCNRGFWRKQLDVFAKEYQVVSLDLGGHGSSGAEREPWKVLGLAGDVVAVMDTLDLKRVVLIGHSLGGPVALETARLKPESVIGVVCVDTVHDADLEFPEGMLDQMIGQFRADYKGTMTQFIQRMFPAGTDPALIQWVTEQANRTDPEVTLPIMKDFENVDLKQCLRGVKAPVRGINAAVLPGLIPKTEIEHNRKYADYDAVLIEGVGHFLQLEKPDAFNAHLAEVLKELTQE